MDAGAGLRKHRDCLWEMQIMHFEMQHYLST